MTIPPNAQKIGGLQFIYDLKSWPDYASLQTEGPASDGAAVVRLLQDHHLSFPHQTVRVRMFHLPSPERRAELMIIQGEALAPNSGIPVRQGGVELDQESPESAQIFLKHGREGLIVRK